jgi:hypothetical protein
MPTRRKYVPKAYRDGGRVLVDTPIAETPAAVADVPAPPEPAAAAATPPPFEFVDNDAVARAVEAQRRAEELQRKATQQSRPMTIEEAIDRAPISDRRKAFLKQHPELCEPRNAPYVEFYYRQSQELGIEDDSDAEHEHVLDGVHGELAHLEQLRNRGRANVAPAPREAHGEAMPPPSTPMPAPAPPPAKRSAPMAAPVSREVPTLSGRPSSDQPSLTAEEREIARISFPHLPALSADYEYFKNKKRYQDMKAAGYWDQKG